MIVDRQTHAQTDTLITIGPTPRSPIEGGVITVQYAMYFRVL